MYLYKIINNKFQRLLLNKTKQEITPKRSNYSIKHNITSLWYKETFERNSKQL